MTMVIIQSAVAVGLTLLILWLSRPLGLRLGVLDMPNKTRKFHARPTPKMGGTALAVAGLACVLLHSLDAGMPTPVKVGVILVACHYIIGLVDDRSDIDARLRLMLSAAATSAAFWLDPTLIPAGLNFSWDMSIGMVPAFAFIAGVLVLVSFVFAVNLIDGRNGILAGYAMLWLTLLQVTAGALPLSLYICAMLCCGAFLIANLRGMVFAGDSGAYLVACTIGVLGLHAHNNGAVSIDQLLLWFIVPVFDAGRVLAVRLRRGQSPFRGGRDHLHHVLWDHLSARWAGALYASATLVPSVLSILAPSLTLLWLVVAATWLLVLSTTPVFFGKLRAV
ncbi:MAG: glycosyltransferase family 4 protein [Elstera sp.]